MTEQITVLSCRSYAKANKTTGEIEKLGCILTYVNGAELKGANETKFRGVEVLEAFLPIEFFEKVPSAPAVYIAEMRMSSFRGRADLKITDLIFVS